MNKRLILLAGLIVILAAALAGCQLALADKGVNDGQDRLVGMLITAEPLDTFIMMNNLKDNFGNEAAGDTVTGGKPGEYKARLYGTPSKKTPVDAAVSPFEVDQFVFEGVTGISFFSALIPDTEARESFHATIWDDAICDKHTKLDVGDLKNSMALEGTLYISPRSALTICFLNPVYQSADGRVYAVPGSGLSNDGADGAESTNTFSMSRKVTQDGKTIKDDTSARLTIKVMNPPEKIVLLQMDNSAAVVSRQEYDPGAVPKAITPERSAEYIVVETHSTDGGGKAQVSRALYNGNAQFLDTFFCREDGVCVKQMTQLNWVK